MRYEILDAPNGNVIGTIVADADFVEQRYPGRHAPLPDPSEAQVMTWLISRLAFKRRFPPSKWKGARQAAKQDGDIEDFFEDFNLVPYVDLQDARTVAAVTAFSVGTIPAGFRLTAAEVEAILRTPAAANELP